MQTYRQKQRQHDCYWLKSIAAVREDMERSWHSKEKEQTETIDERDD